MESKHTQEMIQSIFENIERESDNEKRARMVSGLLEWIQWLHKNNEIPSRLYIQYQRSIGELIGDKNIQSKKPNFTKKYLLFIFIILLFGVTLFVILASKPTRMSDEDMPSVLPFKGSLLDDEGQPITDKTDVIFNLYSSSKSDESLYRGYCQGEQGITPDFNGQFFVTLGSDCEMEPLPQGILQNYSQLFLGVTIGAATEGSQRYLLYTGPINDAATLNSIPLGSKRNTIPFIDTESTINITAEDPVINSTSGIFTLSGASLSLKSTDSQVGNIELTPGILGSILITGGNLGLGTLTPKYKFDLNDTEPNNSVASFSNLSTESAEDMNVLKLGLGVDGSSPTAFMKFYKNVLKDGGGDLVGSIELINDRVVYKSSGADYAEYFETNEYIPVAYIVGLGPTGIRKAHNGDIPVGVVSGDAGFVGNSSSSNTPQVLVGLVGQLQVLVTNQGGGIQPGDSIGIGDIQGLGTKSGTGVIGYSMGPAEFTSRLCPKGLGQSIECAYIDVLLK